MTEPDLDSIYRQIPSPEELLAYLANQIDEFERILKDDEQFCEKEIEATKDYLQQLEGKLQKKIGRCREQLNQLREQNQQTSQRNIKEYEKEVDIVNDSFSRGQHYEAFRKLHDYGRRFQQRETLIRQIPKFNITDSDIDQFFSSEEKKTIIAAPITTTMVVPNNDHDDEAEEEDKQLSAKQIRRQKEIQTTRLERDETDMPEDDREPTGQETDLSTFGIRSKRPEDLNQTKAVPLKKGFSTRLASLKSNSLPFSGRNISPSSSIRDSPQESPTVIPRPRVLNSDQLSRGIRIILAYKHKPNVFLLMACNARHLILFESQSNRQDRWKLGLIERVSQNQQSLEWHGGLIMSMGYIRQHLIYLFTQREMCIYNVLQNRVADSRALPSGSDDDYEGTFHPYENAHRGIGTYHDGYIYHLFFNRTSHWLLSKTQLDNKSHLADFNLSQKINDVQRVLHVNVNDEAMNFLVQKTDHSYAVVFCSLQDCTPRSSTPAVELKNAVRPLRLYSAKIATTGRYVFFVNDPSAGILHILDSTAYLDSFRIMAHAIYYEPEKQELIVATDNAICSMNFNEEDYFS